MYFILQSSFAVKNCILNFHFNFGGFAFHSSFILFFVDKTSFFTRITCSLHVLVCRNRLSHSYIYVQCNLAFHLNLFGHFKRSSFAMHWLFRVFIN